MSTPDGDRHETLIIGVYVDDLFVISSHNDEHSLYQKFIDDLQSASEVEDEGRSKTFSTSRSPAMVTMSS